MGRTQLGTPIATQLARLDKERERLVQLNDSDVVFEIPDNIDQVTPADRIAEIEAVVRNMNMTKVRSLLDFILETIAAAREGGYGRVEGQALPFWIRLRNRQEPALLICLQCGRESTLREVLDQDDAKRKGKCPNCGNGLKVIA
jgi:DNA-directed RNA polymerase subunit RPC12/RpoP